MKNWEAENSRRQADYRAGCEEIEAKNRQLLGPWKATTAAQRAEYERKRDKIEYQNRQTLMEWEAENSRRREHHQRTCEEIEAKNQVLIVAWEESNAERVAEYEAERAKIDAMNWLRLAEWEEENNRRKTHFERTCGEISARNQDLIETWEAANAARMAEYERECCVVEAKNRLKLMEWEEENSRRRAHHQRTCKEIEAKNQGLISAWESLNAARRSEHERACRKIDEENERAIEAWEVANTPWFDEERRWRQRLAAAEADRNMLESELQSKRSASKAIFDNRKKDAQRTATSHSKVRVEYGWELNRAESNSRQIQLEEHLDKTLIRDANIKGISSKLVLALESFGIESAKDVEMLKTRKVPGIGRILEHRLFDWKEGVERTFVPKQGLPESERSRIASRYAPMFLPLGQDIKAAIRDLEIIAASHRARERELVARIEAAVQNAAIAEAHLDALNKMPGVC